MSVGLKVCGVTQVDDLRDCEALGVDAVGINLWPGSPRGLSLDAARALLEAVPRRSLRVGVFCEATPTDVERAATRLGLDAVQIHDDQPKAPFATIGLPWIWVVRGTPDLAVLEVPSPAPLWILLDAHVPGYGGAGQRTDWPWAALAVRALAPHRVWLSGGIHPENAGEAIARVHPAGLDVASGAERPGGPPGAKDRHRVAALRRACG